MEKETLAYLESGTPELINKKSNRRLPIFLRLPIDCLGVIVCFFGKFSDIVHVMIVSKKVKKAIQSSLFVGSPLVLVVREGMKPIEGAFANFVRRIRVEDCFIDESVARRVFRMFPKLEDVNIHHSRFISHKTIQELKYLESLDISSCYSIKMNCLPVFVKLIRLTVSRKNFSSFEPIPVLPLFRNITILKISHDPSILLTPLHITKDIMSNFPSLKEFHGKQCRIREGDGDVFHLQKNLRVLDISRCHTNTNGDICDIHIKNLVNLETLILNYIQVAKSSEEQYCGDLSPEAFKNLYTLERLEINGNFRIDPIILSFLPKLRILSVKGCSKEMITAALRISHRLDLLEVCECLPHKPPTNPNERYSEVHVAIDGKRGVKEGRVHYSCKNCSNCKLCESNVDFSTSFRCDDCHRLICKKESCKSGSLCERCNGTFCKECRSSKFYFGEICSCEWDWLCNKCFDKFFFRCGGCYTTSCDNCSIQCRKCKKKVCWNCQQQDSDCDCKGNENTKDNICKDCGDGNLECFLCFSSTCSSCNMKCPNCKKNICGGYECMGGFCDVCNRCGCNKCMGEMFYCSSCSKSFCEKCYYKTKIYRCKSMESEDFCCFEDLGCEYCKKEKDFEEEGEFCDSCKTKKKKEEEEKKE